MLRYLYSAAARVAKAILYIYTSACFLQPPVEVLSYRRVLHFPNPYGKTLKYHYSPTLWRNISNPPSALFRRALDQPRSCKRWLRSIGTKRANLAPAAQIEMLKAVYSSPLKWINLACRIFSLLFSFFGLLALHKIGVTVSPTKSFANNKIMDDGMFFSFKATLQVNLRTCTIWKEIIE